MYACASYVPACQFGSQMQSLKAATMSFAIRFIICSLPPQSHLLTLTFRSSGLVCTTQFQMLQRQSFFTRVDHSSNTCLSTSVSQRSSLQTIVKAISVSNLVPLSHVCSSSLDAVWVNDYHLMLLPALLRAHPKLVNAPIGFFLHVAFPSSEIFRCLSVRESLLRGLLAADLVGFQTANYARHFRQTVSRILALEALPKGIQVEGNFGSGSPKGRFVDVGVFPMGIDVSALREKKWV